MKAAREKISGVILVDKEENMTSHDLVAKARRSLGMKKVGHAGTLDPFATGLLILMVGEGTKLSNTLMDGEKTYLAKIKLGQKSDTGDRTGAVTEEKAHGDISAEIVRKALGQFKGSIMQKPPMYSAIKVKGVPLYKMARKGQEVDRSEREIFIRDIDLTDLDPPFLTFSVTCSKGTYVRTLAEDISETLGTCGHLVELRRTASGVFNVDDAISVAQLCDRDEVLGRVKSMNDSVPMVPELIVGNDAARRIVNGVDLQAGWVENRISVTDQFACISSGLVKVVDSEGTLLSLVRTEGKIGEINALPPDHLVGKSLRVFNLS